MSRDNVKVKVEGLGAAVQQSLTLYRDDVNAGIRTAAQRAIEQLYHDTKATAPRDRGRFHKAIAWREKPQSNSLYGATFVWYVKAPYYRLTHLIVHGHVTRDGRSRTRGNSFLATATDSAVRQFENDLKEALRG